MRFSIAKNICQTELASVWMANAIILAFSLIFSVGCDSSQKSAANSEEEAITSQIPEKDTSYSAARIQEQRQISELLSSRNLRSHYGEMYRQLPASSSIDGTVTIRYEAQPAYVSDSLSTSLEGNPIELMPIWQRESVRKIRAKRQEIYQDGRRDAESVRSGTPEERRAWTLQWREKVRSQLDQLKKEEAISLRSQATITKEMTFDLLNRLNENDPILEEADLPIIESLLPSADEFKKNRDLKIDDEIARLLEAHRILAEQFPQSVNRERER